MNDTPHDHSPEPIDWKHNGVKVIPGDQLDTNTPQTPGMNRAAAINKARVGAQKIWAGTVNIHANAKTGAHHHGALESVIYVVRGKARMRWGEKLEFVAEADPGDFIFVPPYVPHQEINASSDETLECVLVRSDNEAVVVRAGLGIGMDAHRAGPDLLRADPGVVDRRGAVHARRLRGVRVELVARDDAHAVVAPLAVGHRLAPVTVAGTSLA